MRWLRASLVMTLLLMVAVVACVFGFMTAVAQNAPNLNQFEARQPAAVGYIFARDPTDPNCQAATPQINHCHWITIGTLRAASSGVLLAPKQIGRTIKQAIVAIEDRRFYQNPGFDLQGIARALVDRVLLGTQEGGSTITQQLVKNTYLNSAQTVRRKFQEIMLAYQLDRQIHNKDRILADYLNTIYFGHGCYGIAAAARFYYDTAADRLTVPQAATLAAIPKSPAAFDPLNRPAAATARRDLVIDDMVSQGYLTPLAGALAKQAPLMPPGIRHALTFGATQVPYFVEYVTSLLVNRYGDRAFTGGLRVYTSIDLREQALAEQVVHKRLQGIGPEGSLVTIDPSTGEVKAMVGGSDFQHHPFNIATGGHRQAGSSFKAFVLAAALRRGIQPATQIESKRLVIQLDPTHYQRIFNDTPFYHGWINLNQATTVSDNTVFAQLTEIVHPTAVVQAAHAFGITTPLDPNPEIGLGALHLGVTPLEMAHGYSTLANEGVRVGGSILFHTPDSGFTSANQDPRSILWITFPDGHVDNNMPTSHNAFSSDQSINTNDARTELDTMRGVTISGTAINAAIPARTVIGKTGTTSDFKDAWFVGMTPQRVTAVWVGYTNPARPMKTEYHGHEVFGGTIPAEIYKAFTQQELKGQPNRDWPSASPISDQLAVVDTSRDPWELAPSGCGGLLPLRSVQLVLASDHIPSQTEPASDCNTRLTTVPDLTGLTPATAAQFADGQRLFFDYQLVPAKPGQKPGRVLDQAPLPGELVPWNSSVLVDVPQIVPLVVVPPVVGSARAPVGVAQAVALLETSGFKVVLQGDVQAPGVADGTVVGQDLRAGSAQPVGSVVTIAVVGHVSGVLVPNVTGYTLVVAARRLRAAGLRYTPRRRNGQRAARSDVVVTSDIEAGTLVPRGTPIGLSTARRQSL